MANPKNDLLAGDGTHKAILDKNTHFEGKLTFEQGPVRIDGEFKGTIITSAVLEVGQGGKVEAEITCGTIRIDGEVNGNIRAKTSVELSSDAHVRGDIECPSIVIEKGATFDGNCKMSGTDKNVPAKPLQASASASAVKA